MNPQGTVQSTSWQVERVIGWRKRDSGFWRTFYVVLWLGWRTPREEACDLFDLEYHQHAIEFWRKVQQDRERYYIGPSSIKEIGWMNTRATATFREDEV